MTATADQRLSFLALVGLVVGSMIGAGIFALPSAFARATGGLGGLIAWGIAGFGMLMLAFVFRTLSERKPELDAGIYAYAKAGFGDYLGFSSALGYWTACCLADVALLVLLKATLGGFFPIFGEGTTLAAILGASALVWGVHFLILRGVKQAAALNSMVTVAKILPILVFILVAGKAFRADVFALNFWGGPVGDLANVFGQVRQTMLVTVFVFVGIEGASVYSRYAKNRADVGLATVVGFLGVLCLLVLVTMLSYGVLMQPGLAALRKPSMSGVMQAVVGSWGGLFISAGLVISVLGAYLSWALLAAEVVHSAALNETMPSFLAWENENQAPVAALWLSNIVIQVFLILASFSEYAFTLALKMTSAMVLIPYLLVAAYGLKLAGRGDTYEDDARGRRIDWVCAAIATLYAGGMIYAGGMKFVLLSAVIYAPGSLLFVVAKREKEQTVFSFAEGLVFGIFVAAAMAGVYGLISGAISI